MFPFCSGVARGTKRSPKKESNTKKEIAAARERGQARMGAGKRKEASPRALVAHTRSLGRKLPMVRSTYCA